MNCAIKMVVPMIRRYKSVMDKAVGGLEKHHSLSGKRIKNHEWNMMIHSSRCRFAERLNSSIRQRTHHPY
jgi:hypothetical protein